MAQQQTATGRGNHKAHFVDFGRVAKANTNTDKQHTSTDKQLAHTEREREEGQRVAKSIAYFSAYTSQVTTKRVVASVCVFEWVYLCVCVCVLSDRS